MSRHELGGKVWVVDDVYTPTLIAGRGEYGLVAYATRPSTRHEIEVSVPPTPKLLSSALVAPVIRSTRVVIKRTSPFRQFDETDTKRIYRELRVLRRLRHPNIVSALDMCPPELGSRLTHTYLVMEAMDESLDSVLRRRVLSVAQIRSLMRQLADALNFLHGSRVIHRDIKPSNILIDSNGDLKLGDFGLARVFPPNGTLTDIKSAASGEIVTRWYRAPELLLEGPIYGTAIDMWALGCVFYEMLTGRPFAAATTSLRQTHLIFENLGWPDPNIILGMSSLDGYKRYDAWWKCRTATHQVNWNALAQKFDADTIELLRGLLTIEPSKRWTANDVVQCQFLESAQNPYKVPPPSPLYESEAGWPEPISTSLIENWRYMFWTELLEYRPYLRSEFDQWVTFVKQLYPLTLSNVSIATPATATTAAAASPPTPNGIVSTSTVMPTGSTPSTSSADAKTDRQPMAVDTTTTDSKTMLASRAEITGTTLQPPSSSSIETPPPSSSSTGYSSAVTGVIEPSPIASVSKIPPRSALSTLAAVSVVPYRPTPSLKENFPHFVSARVSTRRTATPRPTVDLSIPELSTITLPSTPPSPLTFPTVGTEATEDAKR